MRKRNSFAAAFVCTCLSACAASNKSAPSPNARIPKSDEKSNMTYHSSETNSVCLTATMHRSNRLGEPIFIDYKLQNNRDVAVWLDHSENAGDIWMKMITERHESVPLTDLGKLHDRGDPYEFTHNIRILLQPHAILTWRYNLCDYFEITKPGRYLLSVIRTVGGIENDPTSGGEDQEVDIGPIIFSVENGIEENK